MHHVQEVQKIKTRVSKTRTLAKLEVERFNVQRSALTGSHHQGWGDACRAFQELGTLFQLGQVKESNDQNIKGPDKRKEKDDSSTQAPIKPDE